MSGRRVAATSALGAREGGSGHWEAPGAWEEEKRLAEGQGARDA